MTPTEVEQVENLRRIAERGLRYAQEGGVSVDTWQHMLDEIGRLKTYSSPANDFPCNECLGKGFVIVDSNPVTCTGCNGTKRVHLPLG